MNDDDRDRHDESASRDADERPAIVAYDPYFPTARRDGEPAPTHRFDPHFPSDGASDFD